MRTSNRHFTRRLACLAAIVLGSNVATQAQQPDNAAQLYYQAFLQYEGPQGSEGDVLNFFWSGLTDSNEVITSYIERNRDVIDLVTRAANIKHCDWGCDYLGLGSQERPPHLAGS